MSDSTHSRQTSYGPYSAVAGPNGTATVNVTINGREISIPVQLPPPVDHFTNRTAELARIIDEVRPGVIGLSQKAAVKQVILND